MALKYLNVYKKAALDQPLWDGTTFDQNQWNLEGKLIQQQDQVMENLMM